MVRLDLVETFTGQRIISVRVLVPLVSRGRNSLPKPSPRPHRSQRLEKQ